jgi:hypothetical protein
LKHLSVIILLILLVAGACKQGNFTVHADKMQYQQVMVKQDSNLKVALSVPHDSILKFSYATPIQNKNSRISFENKKGITRIHSSNILPKAFNYFEDPIPIGDPKAQIDEKATKHTQIWGVALLILSIVLGCFLQVSELAFLFQIMLPIAVALLILLLIYNHRTGKTDPEKMVEFSKRMTKIGLILSSAGLILSLIQGFTFILPYPYIVILIGIGLLGFIILILSLLFNPNTYPKIRSPRTAPSLTQRWASFLIIFGGALLITSPLVFMWLILLYFELELAFIIALSLVFLGLLCFLTGIFLSLRAIRHLEHQEKTRLILKILLFIFFLLLCALLFLL